ncbi:helix-turn-helix domain-containing protein [Companilactobacillus alimentarius]|uniref:helix-turn-helix domain-containing protein n=1 Tax=Companilactobacillus alimentarius TaxID=1602 RepID=UPI003D7D42E5
MADIKPLYIRIKDLANEHKESLASIERTLNFSNGLISTWKSREASTDKVGLVAKHFGVSIDYLMGNTDKRELDSSNDSESYYRMDTDGLSPTQIKELKEQIEFAEKLALKNIKKD